MPSGAKKRKAAKKKKERSIHDHRQHLDPLKNPNPNTSSSLHQGNGHDGNEFATPRYQEEAEEKFETPRSEADFIDRTIESFVNGRGEVKDDIVTLDDGEMVEKSLKENIESVEQSIPVTKSVMDLDLVGKVDNLLEIDDDSSKGKEFHENPTAFIEAVDNTTKGETFHSKDGGLSVAEQGDDDGVGRRSEGKIQIDEGTKELELQKSVPENSEALGEAIGISFQEKEAEAALPRVDEGSKEMNFDKLSVANVVPIEHSVVTEEANAGDKASPESCETLAGEIDNGRKSGVPPGNEECSKEGKVNNLVAEGNVVPLENSVSVEKISQTSKEPAENHETLVGVKNTLSQERKAEMLPLLNDAGETFRDASGTQVAPRNEVAHGPLVVRRASLWNCCGLLDVVTSSER